MNINAYTYTVTTTGQVTTIDATGDTVGDSGGVGGYVVDITIPHVSPVGSCFRKYAQVDILWEADRSRSSLERGGHPTRWT